MRRITVNRMLKKRLAESKSSINVSYRFEDLSNVYGSDCSKEEQLRINLQKDIEELEYLINCLKYKENIQELIKF